ncbi:gp436 family protein [Nitrosomonas oligotropha]|uniref:gp436 family protein n=1 Tax=Nitrosomonas oligotropha TaxID=42354 RepID=UPI00137022F1|nr:DUF1320 domain-containing protein [Nitrosomonas oligotropha]MXS82270.1 DUF1320 domain-containing protein [Nitrosomonas oligotropha]
MTYASQQNMIDRFGEDELIQLTDRDSLGAIDATVINRALGDADATINGYLAARYTLPLANPVPEMLERFACDIARYALYDDGVKEAIETRYKDAIAYLRDVSTGKADLGVSDTSNKPASTATAQMSSTTPVFRREDSQGFI